MPPKKVLVASPACKVPRFMGETNLSYAIRCCDLQTVEKIFASNPNIIHDYILYDPRYTYRVEGSPLNIAADIGCLEIVRFFIKNGADVNAQSRFRHTPLALASEKGYFEIAKLLIENGADVNNMGSFEYHEYTPLMIATEKGYLELAKLLIANGANVNQEGYHKYTPLIIASEKGHFEIAKVLIENGADTNKGNIFNYAPLIIATENGHFEIAKLLIENGADVNGAYVNDEGVKKINPSKYTPLGAASEIGPLELVQLLIKHGANVKDASDALINASYRGRLDIIKFLIEKGADVNKKDRLEDTALTSAIRSGYLKTANFLIENGADVNITSGFERYTPLSIAASNRNVELTKFLIEKGANVNTVDRRGTPLLTRIVSMYDFHEIVKLLIGAGATPTPEIIRYLLRKIKPGEALELIELLKARGVDLSEVRNATGSTLLHEIAKADRKVSNAARRELLGPEYIAVPNLYTHPSGEMIVAPRNIYGRTPHNYARLATKQRNEYEAARGTQRAGGRRVTRKKVPRKVRGTKSRHGRRCFRKRV